MASEKNQNLKLGKYPYLNARMRAMKSKLVSAQDYPKLLKMSHDEISRFIGEGEYKKEMDSLAVRHSGADLLEHAINANASKCFRKIISISRDDARVLITEYLKRWDVANLKSVLRGIFSGAKGDETKTALIPGGQLSEKALLDILERQTIPEALKHPAVLKAFPSIKDYRAPQDGAELASIENWLDMNYYTGLTATASSLPKSAQVFTEFLENEIDVVNISTLLVMKKEGAETKDIMKTLIFPGGALTRKTLRKAASSEKLGDVIELFGKTAYAKEVAGGKDEALEGSFSAITRELYKTLMRKAFLLLHQNPLSIAPVLGYILAKEIEIKNLKMLSRAKALSLPEEFMEQNIIVA